MGAESQMQAFQCRQKQLCDYIRDPDGAVVPTDIDTRRLQIYRDLFFNNFNGLLSNSFPVCHSLCSDADWNKLVRTFIREHRCQSPYFLDIAAEFLGYLETVWQRLALPEFFYELAHYEWVELALDTAEESLPAAAGDDAGAPGALFDQVLTLSPLAWPLAYRFPVHRIGRHYQPEQADGNPTFLVVYRNRQDAVQFMEINAATAQLLEAFSQHGEHSVREVVCRFAADTGQAPEPLCQFAEELILQLLQADIVNIAERR